MNLSFDPTVPAELAAAQRMLDGLSGNKTIELRLDPRTVDKLPTVAEAAASVGERAAAPTAQQCDSMDDTGGIRSVSVPPPVAPSTAAAPASPSVPEAPQDGQAVDPSVFGQSAAPGPVPPAPTVPVAETSPALDASGRPWDERIHAGSKAKNADGTWRQRRNLPDGLREQVEAELRGQSAAAGAASSATSENTAPTVSSPASDAPAAPAVSAPPLPPVAPVAPPVPSLPAIPSSTPPAAAPAPAGATASGEPMVAEGDFVALFGKVTKLMTTQPGVFGESDVADICAKLGIPSMMVMPTRPDLVLQFDAAVEELFA